MKRRDFLALSTAALAGTRDSSAPAQLTRRDRMLRWLAGETQPGYTPAAFFLHFGDAYRNGPAAAQKHLEFFRHTGMDFVKIQFEQLYSPAGFIQKPSDWAKIKPGKLDFYEPLLVTLRELIKAEKKNSLIVMTLYSPFMCAGHLATTPMLIQHLEENPDAVRKGLEIVTNHQMLFVRACIKEGIDGFYMSTQGSEQKRLSRPEIFTKYIRPYDLVAMTEVAKRCPLSIVHVCDFVAPYADYNATKDYPGHVINCNVKLTDRTVTPQEITKLFNRPFMGGMDRHGVIATGSPAEVETEIKRVIANSPRQMILGADCTVDADTNWDRLRHAIDVAHNSAA